MDTSTVLLIVAIVAVLALALVMVLATARRRANVGALSRETRRHDAGTTPEAVQPGTALAEVDAEARERAAEATQALAPTGARTPAERTPVDEETLGETRRQFLNRGVLSAMSLALAAFGAAMLGFLWPPPSSAGGFGGTINVGSLADIDDTIDNQKKPYYNASAKTNVVKYPKADLAKAKKVPGYKALVAGMELGYVALYQKCVHLGCKVPFCDSSQWFECPCHGSKYNRVGEKRGGPAPRGLDRFVLSISGDNLSVDTSTIIQGPPIGTDTTGQSPEGAPCV